MEMDARTTSKRYCSTTLINLSKLAKLTEILGMHGRSRMTAEAAPLTRKELREELDRVLVHYATKADLAELKADLAKLESRLTWRVVGLQIASMIAIAAILRFLA